MRIPLRLAVRPLAFVLAAGFAAQASPPLAAQNIDILSIADSRFNSGWTLDGSAMSSTRAKLLDGDVFGPGGVVDRTVVIQDTAATITPALLSGVEILFIGYLDDDN